MSTAAKAAESLNVPVGIRGAHREAYLALTDSQKARFRYMFVACGRYAVHCFADIAAEDERAAAEAEAAHDMPLTDECSKCGADLEHETNAGWVDALSGDDGGTYDICPEDGKRHAPKLHDVPADTCHYCAATLTRRNEFATWYADGGSDTCPRTMYAHTTTAYDFAVKLY